MIKNIEINGFPLHVPNRSIITNLIDSESAKIALATYDRGGRDGVVLGNRFYRQMAFTIQFDIIAANSVDLLEQRKRYLGQLYSRDKKRIDVFLDNGTIRSCMAQVTSISAPTTPEQANKWCRITIQFIADKWYWEGAEHIIALEQDNLGGMAVPMDVPMSMTNGGETEDSNSQVINGGNTEGLPRFHVQGPLTSFDIFNQTNGTQLTVTTSLEDGEYIDLDCFHHTAIKNGVTNIRGSVSNSVDDWIVLIPGSNRVVFAANFTQLGHRAEIIYRDAYLGAA